MQVVIVGDELYGGVPDVLGGELASPLDEGNHDVCVPLQVREEPAIKLIAAGLSSALLNPETSTSLQKRLCYSGNLNSTRLGTVKMLLRCRRFVIS